MAAVYTPVHLIDTATAGGETLDFGQDMGAVTIENLDDTNIAYVKLDGMPAAAATNGNIVLLPGHSISIPNIKFQTIGIISAGTALVQAVAVPYKQC